MLHLLISIVSFLVIISIIVFIHEFGHYIVAKWAGVKIDTFSLGFGKEIWGWNDKSGTRWKVSNLPLGGYVKMFGDATEASAPIEEIEHLSDEEKQKAFYYKPLYKKAAIVVAGPLFNFLLTIVILSALILTRGLQSSEPVVDEVAKGYPAELAGIQAKDRILSINGNSVVFFSDISRLLITNLGTPVSVDIERDGKKLTVTMTPKLEKDKDALGEEYTHPIIGIKSRTIQVRTVGPVGAVWEAVRGTYYLCDTTLRVVGQIISGERSARDTIKGPVGMANMSGKAAEQGIQHTILLMALISANLGLVNLFPIPVLDGGHLLFYAIEAVTRRPPGKRFQEYGMRMGMAIVAMLMTYAILNDLRGWLAGFMNK